ncbi:MAG: bifunctional methylenetetrahydrofolate dehydrogenase/methenyltetrahydrofolate cyclohydrolase FolD [Pseudomonadota bacterium]
MFPEHLMRLDGKKVAEHIQQRLTQLISTLPIKPCLTVILVGQDPASEIYVGRKHQACEAVGIVSRMIKLPDSISETELLTHITSLNNDTAVHGILVQLPLPAHISPQSILEAIDPKKDVDGFHPYNLGLLAARYPGLRPCTPRGVMSMLEFYEIDLKGLHAVIVGASNIVGRPMALELLLAGCTITVCHRFTKNLAEHVAKADIVVAAAGKPHLIKSNWIKKGAIIIDVGIHRTSHGIIGDVEITNECLAFAATPVPGGVGPMTVATLLHNTVSTACVQNKLNFLY